MSNNPLNNIFAKNNEGQLTNEVENINNIHFFFDFILDDKVKDEEKIITLKEFESKIKVNRYISEFFSFYNNKSIYIYLFDLYTNENTSETLKDAIISLIEELLYNIQTGKEIYEYLFQKLSQIYRGEIPPKENNLYIYLKLLKTILSELESRTPKCYFACCGNCQFEIDLNESILHVGYSFTLNLNFKISNYQSNESAQENNRISNLVEIFFDNKNSISIDLQYPLFLIVKKIRKEFIKSLPLDEWINLFITIVISKNDLIFHFLVNGENHNNYYKLQNFGITPNTTIKYIRFFHNFFGEVNSIYMFTQNEPGNPGILNTNFLSQMKNYCEGLWKKKKIDSFLKILTNYESIIKEQKKADEKKKSLFDNLLFLFSPMNTSSRRPNIVEDAFGKFQIQFSGNIRVHKYQSYQKKLLLIGDFANFYPIAEMFLIYPEILTEKNFEIFLKTIRNILNLGKKNLNIINKCKLFKILSMFMEKYPKKIYTENILNVLFSFAKTLFTYNLEKEGSNFFNYILLNEKILSKYNENLQSTFWKKLFLFCQSDITLVKTFLNINRLCLILRFYDKNKYKEMCCQKHLDMIKDHYIGSPKVMNPTLNTKLSQLKDIMNLIIDSSELNNAIVFFKLLILDLSPCLILFIIHIFIKAFDNPLNEKWKNILVQHLIDAKFEIIIFNTFIHSLPDVRIEILKFISQIHNRMILCKKTSNIETLEEMIKTCLLPENMFYSEKIIIKGKDNNIIINEEKEKQNETKVKEANEEDKNNSKNEDYKKEYLQDEKYENNKEKIIPQNNIIISELNIQEESNSILNFEEEMNQEKKNSDKIKQNEKINNKEEKDIEEDKIGDNIKEELINCKDNIEDKNFEVNDELLIKKEIENVDKEPEEVKIIDIKKNNKEDNNLDENINPFYTKESKNNLQEKEKIIIVENKIDESIIDKNNTENKKSNDNINFLIKNEIESKSEELEEVKKIQMQIEESIKDKNNIENKTLNDKINSLIIEEGIKNVEKIEDIKANENIIEDSINDKNNMKNKKSNEKVNYSLKNKESTSDEIENEKEKEEPHDKIFEKEENEIHTISKNEEQIKSYIIDKKNDIKNEDKTKHDNKKHDIGITKDFHNKKDGSNIKNITKEDFLALVSKFEKPKKEDIKNKPKKASLKLINKDNPFLKLIESQNKKYQEEKKKRKEKERIEKERIEQEKIEKEKMEKERIEQEKLEQERIEKEKLEQERLEQERIEQEKIEKEKMEKERLEQERIEKERLEKEKMEKERLEQERLEHEKLEQERIEKERIEQERLEQERMEQKRLEQERLEKEKLEQERIEQERIEQERIEQEKLEQERMEQERLEKEKLEQERIEQERLEQERIKKEQKKNEKIILENEKDEILIFNMSDEGKTKKKVKRRIKKQSSELILKENIYKEYIEKLYTVFILWTFSIDVSIPYDAIFFKNLQIRNTNGIEFIFLLDKRVQNKTLLILFLNTIQKIIDIPENSFIILKNLKIFSSFLEVAFNNYKLEGKNEKECYDLCKNIIIRSFINSLDYCNKQMNNKYPAKKIETLFIWGNKAIQENNDIREKVNDFLFELIMEFIAQFLNKYEPKIKTNSIISYDVKKNYFLKNYLLMIRCNFNFAFRYQLDEEIYINGLEIFNNNSSEIEYVIINSMRIINNSSSSKIAEIWKDFPLINEIISKTKKIWSKKNCFKGINVEYYKKNKIKKYEFIIENIIIDKDITNLYQNELEFLCFEEKSDKIELIIPVIKIIPITFVCILSILKNFDDDKDFNYWLKELKYFLRFLIISSANLNKLNQFEIYNYIQEKALEAIALGFCFLYRLYSIYQKENNKLEKYLVNLFLLSFKILKYQYYYKLNQKKRFNFTNKTKTNNLEDCAICKLFETYAKDKEDNPLIDLNFLENLELESNSYYNDILDIITNSDFTSAFFENQQLKEHINKNIYSFLEYKYLVKERFGLIPKLSDIFNDSYKRTILFLLPQYENELAKYSNNSLEKKIKIKNKYKVFKKNIFSWSGYWSCRDNFYKNISSFKLKLINHYTKNFMKPILKPIIDISYYLPEFSGFDPNQLFLEDNENKIFKLNMDIDKVFKSSESNNQENISEDNNKNIEENYLVNIYKKSNPDLYEKLLKISNNLEFGKEEEFFMIQRDNSKEIKKKYFLCCLVKTSHHIKGVVFIDEKKLNFKIFLNQKTGNAMSGVEIGFTTKDDDYDQERKTCFGSFFVCHPKDKDLCKISINYKDIKWIFKRKYYYYNSALEIFTTTNKTFYINFKYEKDRTSFLKEILKKLDEPIQIIDDLKDSKFQNVIGYENGKVQLQKDFKKNSISLSKIVKSWKNWEISNFEFLMWLNIFGNRSYNDISQYPIFPWILINYDDPLKVEQKEEKEIIEYDFKKSLSKASNLLNSLINLNNDQKVQSGKDNEQQQKMIIDYLYRDLSLPMGMLEVSEESKKRKKEFCRNYESLLECEDDINKPYVFGSNYSNPIYVCNFLVRLFPFTHISIEMQGKNFDDPNRMFISVKQSFINSSTEKGDVRELIPEFFYLPEMFKNVNKLNMGKLENGKQVDDVTTPCKNNPYDFIMTMRYCLESNKISNKLNEWINLIFGYKQRGKEAEKIKNIYKESCYQEIIDINKEENKSDKLREAEFGLIPNQLMVKECLKREKKEIIKKGKLITEDDCDLQCQQCKFDIEKNIFHEIEGLNVVKMACFNQEKLLILLGGVVFVERKISYSIFEKTYNDETLNMLVINKYYHKMKEFYNPKKPDTKVIKFCHKGRTAVFGGFYDGKVLIKSTLSEQKDNYKVDIPFVDNSPVVALEVSQDDELVFFGNEMGNIRIMKLSTNIKESQMDLLITDQLSPISYIYCNSELNLWISASIDGYINLYTLPLSKLLRSLKVDTSYCEYAFLSSSPLPSIIVIGEDNNTSEIFVYSINGELYLRQKEQDIIKNPLILRDLNSNEYLAYIMNESIIIRTIPTLILQSRIENIPDLFCIYPSEDMKLLYAINKTGRYIKIIKNGF